MTSDINTEWFRRKGKYLGGDNIGHWESQKRDGWTTSLHKEMFGVTVLYDN
jgi:hypothetical protein